MVFLEIIGIGIVVLIVGMRILQALNGIKNGINELDTFYPDAKEGYFIFDKIGKHVSLKDSRKSTKESSYSELLSRIEKYLTSVIFRGASDEVIERYLDRAVDDRLNFLESSLPKVLYNGLLGTIGGIIVTFLVLSFKIFFESGSDGSDSNWDDSILIIVLGVAISMSVTAFAIFSLNSISENLNQLNQKLTRNKHDFILKVMEEMPASAEDSMKNNFALLANSFQDFSEKVSISRENIKEQNKLMEKLAMIDFGKISESVIAFANVFPDLEKFHQTSNGILSFVQSAQPLIEGYFNSFSSTFQEDLHKRKIDLSNTLDKYQMETSEYIKRISEWIQEYNKNISESITKQELEIHAMVSSSKPELANLKHLQSIDNRMENLSQLNHLTKIDGIQTILSQQNNELKELQKSFEFVKEAFTNKKKSIPTNATGKVNKIEKGDPSDFWKFIDSANKNSNGELA
jgi:hypothetical protein